jgi:hypothetical protein
MDRDFSGPKSVPDGLIGAAWDREKTDRVEAAAKGGDNY